MKSDDGYLAKLEKKLERMYSPGRPLSSKDIIKQLELARQSAFDTSCSAATPVVLDVCSLELDDTVEHKRLSTKHAVDASELVLLVSDDWLDKIHCSVRETAAAASGSAGVLAVRQAPASGQPHSDVDDNASGVWQCPDDSRSAMQEGSARPNSSAQSPWPLPLDGDPAALFDERGFGADDHFIVDAAAAAAVADGTAAAGGGARARTAVTAATHAAAVLCDKVVGTISVSAQEPATAAQYATGAGAAAAAAAVTHDRVTMNVPHVAPASTDNFEPFRGADR